MKKNEFLKELNHLLKDVSEDERKEILFDYSEHFGVGLAEGRTEEDIAKSLGDPKVIVKEMSLNYKTDEVKENDSVGNVFRVLFLSILLGFFNLVFILGPFIGIVGIIIGLYAVGVALTISGISIFIGSFVKPLLPQYINIPVNFFVSIFASIGVTCLGALWTIGSIYFSKYFYKLTVKYLKMNQNIIMDRRNRSEV